jgi:uncharacterized metal-binding protein YceD (DUF177 family)
MSKPSSIAPEFSRLVPVERLEAGDLAESIAATPEEREALARRFDLLAIERLDANVALRRIGRGPVVRLEGRLEAELVQTCVVSLEPVEGRVAESFSIVYMPENHEAGDAILRTGAFDEDDEWPEPIVEGRIDIGEAVAQQLALALDPSPRKSGISLEDVIGNAATGDDRPASPFAVLAGLVARKD